MLEVLAAFFLNPLRHARRVIDQTLGRDVRAPIQVRCRREFLGSGYGGWCVCPDGLNRQSVVYSFGVGQDISWDLAMIDRFGVTVHAFDPTPKSIRWIAEQKLPASAVGKFVFHEHGLADYDGTAHFVLPNPDFVSFSMAGVGDREPHVGNRIEVDAPVQRLATTMRALGHTRLDVLKLDIEGAEIAVIQDLAKSDVEIGQVLVEFHHRVGVAAEVETTRKAIAQLNELGFRLFHNSMVGKEFSFVRAEAGSDRRRTRELETST